MKKIFKRTIIALMVTLILSNAILNCNYVNASSISLNKKSVTIKVGNKIKLKVNGEHIKNVKWTSLNTSIVTVTSRGKVYAENIGKTTIVAEVSLNNGKAKVKQCKVTVKKKNTVDPTEIKGGLWVSKSEDEDGRNYGIYFLDVKTLLIGWIEKDSDYEGGYFIKGNPYNYKITSKGISVSAGYGFGSDIVEDEISDGIPKLKYDGKSINAIGGEIDGMTFYFKTFVCEYVIDD